MQLTKPHRRYNPLKDEWILVSPQRTQRPWQGKLEHPSKKNALKYDPSCYICPGNLRVNGNKNPDYKDTFVFNNDFPALIYKGNFRDNNSPYLFQSESVSGECRVISFSPRHDLTLADMTQAQIVKVISIWISEYRELNKKYTWIQIFENKGELMGCSNPHPHGQIWAGNFIPAEVKKEDIQQKKYFEKNNSVLLLDYLKQEQEINDRIIFENENWVVLTPFWAVWPYETLVMHKKLLTRLDFMSEVTIQQLAAAMKKLLIAYDRLFNTSMPYSMGWHFAPENKSENKYWQLHAHYYPPLLRSSTVKKFMVGYEMLAEAQRDITPEASAEKLRSLT